MISMGYRCIIFLRKWTTSITVTVVSINIAVTIAMRTTVTTPPMTVSVLSELDGSVGIWLIAWWRSIANVH